MKKHCLYRWTPLVGCALLALGPALAEASGPGQSGDDLESDESGLTEIVIIEGVQSTLSRILETRRVISACWQSGLITG